MLNIEINRAVRLMAVALIPAGIITGTIANYSALAHHPNNNDLRGNDFDLCLRKLLAANILERVAGDACARALEPIELGTCVEEIDRETPVDSRNALANCFQVRRPPELSTCVTDIYREEKTNRDLELETLREYANLTVDFCRRSLLPERYSNCVIALNRELGDVFLPEALQICISAEAYPESLFPPRVTEE